MLKLERNPVTWAKPTSCVIGKHHCRARVESDNIMQDVSAHAVEAA